MPLLCNPALGLPQCSAAARHEPPGPACLLRVCPAADDSFLRLDLLLPLVVRAAAHEPDMDCGMCSSLMAMHLRGSTLIMTLPPHDPGCVQDSWPRSRFYWCDRAGQRWALRASCITTTRIRQHHPCGRPGHNKAAVWEEGERGKRAALGRGPLFRGSAEHNPPTISHMGSCAHRGYIWDGTANRVTAPIRNPLNKSHMPAEQVNQQRTTTFTACCLHINSSLRVL